MSNVSLDDFKDVSIIPHDMSALNREAPRYLFFAGDLWDSKLPGRPAGGLDLGSPVVKPPMVGPPGFLHRCLITPCTTATRTILKEEVPEGIRSFRQREAMDAGKIVAMDLVDVALYPGPEVDNLITLYGGWGVIEVKALAGKTPAEVSQMRLNTTIFPNWPDLPKLNSDVIAHLRRVWDTFAQTGGAAAKLLTQVVDELIQGTERCDEWMRARLDATHGAMALPAGDSHRKAVYDRQDLHFLERTGLQRRDQELRTIVDTQSLIAQALAKPAGGDDMEKFKAILDANREAIAEMFRTMVPAPAPIAPPPIEEPVKKTGTKG